MLFSGCLGEASVVWGVFVLVAACCFDWMSFDCAAFECCSHPGPFICCPECGDASTHVVRVGVVGVRGVDDSRRFYCEACGIFFSSRGATFWEERGRHR